MLISKMEGELNETGRGKENTKGMTLILGVRCNDGVVLASDRIFEVGGTLIAFEGLTDICDDFLRLLRSAMDRIKEFTNIYEVKLVLEDIVGDLSKRYRKRSGSEGSIGTLLAGLSRISAGNAVLYYVHPRGYAESVNYRCSGYGADSAHSIAKFLFDSKGSCQNNAFLAAFFISWVSEDVDMMEGSEPQVVIMKDNTGVEYLSNDLVRQASQRARQLKSRLVNDLGLQRYFTD
jgi:20S proteasome alpha/beta subunit